MLPQTSKAREFLQDLAADHTSLLEETEPADEAEKVTGQLTSEFEIQERPGLRQTKISQKLRQERDRANMTTADTKYTALLEELNDFLQEILSYPFLSVDLMIED